MCVKSRIESKLEISTYLERLRYALSNGAHIQFQTRRSVDEKRDIHFTNQYTISTLFPDEDPVEALKRELSELSIENYIKTVKDLRFPKRSEMREFGKIYNGHDEVYIKIRVELLGRYNDAMTFVMSFHFAERPFAPDIFPYKTR